MKKITTILMLLVIVATVSSCKKATTAAAPSTTPPSVTPPSDAAGAFAAVISKTNTTVGGITVPLEIGLAVAWFGASGAFVDGGNVTCNANALTKTNNAYAFQPASATPTGIDFSSSTVAWTGSGAGSVAAFSYNDVSAFPSADDITSSTEVSTASSYTLTTSGTTGSQDSVIFNISGPNKNILKVLPAYTTSYTFTAAEMGTLGTGSNSGVIQIAPYRVNGQTINGKKYYFVKETCVTKFINLK